MIVRFMLYEKLKPEKGKFLALEIKTLKTVST